MEICRLSKKWVEDLKFLKKLYFLKSTKKEFIFQRTSQNLRQTFRKMFYFVMTFSQKFVFSKLCQFLSKTINLSMFRVFFPKSITCLFECLFFISFFNKHTNNWTNQNFEELNLSYNYCYQTFTLNQCKSIKSTYKILNKYWCKKGGKLATVWWNAYWLDFGNL